MIGFTTLLHAEEFDLAFSAYVPFLDHTCLWRRPSVVNLMPYCFRMAIDGIRYSEFGVTKCSGMEFNTQCIQNNAGIHPLDHVAQQSVHVHMQVLPPFFNLASISLQVTQ